VYVQAICAQLAPGATASSVSQRAAAEHRRYAAALKTEQRQFEASKAAG